MSHVKAGGSSKNVHDSPGQRLGVKRFGGQIVNEGEVLVRQVGQTKIAGPGTFLSRNFTIHAAKDGIVGFKSVKIKRFTGKTTARTQVVVTDKPEAASKTTAKTKTLEKPKS
jgi:large subunit ribosomal protein L27